MIYFKTLCIALMLHLCAPTCIHSMEREENPLALQVIGNHNTYPAAAHTPHLFAHPHKIAVTPTLMPTSQRKQYKEMRTERLARAELLQEKFCFLAREQPIENVHMHFLNTGISPDVVDEMPDGGLALRTALLPEDMRKHTMEDYVFDGHKPAYEKFSEENYAHELVAFAYAVEGANKNTIQPLSYGDRYGASPELRSIYIRFSNRRYLLSLHDEYIIRTEMPERVARELSDFKFLCQRPYFDRLLPALKNGLWCGMKGMEYGGFAPTRLLLPKELFEASNIVQHLPLSAQYGARLQSLVFLGRLPGCIDDSLNIMERVGMNPLSQNQRRYPIFGGPIAILPIELLLMFKWPPLGENIVRTASKMLIGGAIGTAYGFCSSLQKQSREYPRAKSIGDIKQLPKLPAPQQ
jgi:hypothetical protein